ncbi:hypothetical protein OH720_18295 [Pseudomonas sp. WJP1]|uniref:hypothetical protein n=1 Tax=Pseudomonas sp. WJP1 TaxID=2986947 RepID=UPI00234B2682|nr:hypothetical protein [Pseudomonas sp. WJP1]WCM48962.1 hypothetical protein OH720_18295 [Pseudomonas sp. WJP1]
MKNIMRVTVEGFIGFGGGQILSFPWKRVSENSAILASITTRRKGPEYRGSKKIKFTPFPLHDTYLECVNGFGKGGDKKSGVLVSFHVPDRDPFPTLSGDPFARVPIDLIFTFVCMDDFSGLDFDKYYIDSFAALNRIK